MMYIFRLGIFEERRRARRLLPDLLETLQDADEFICGEKARTLQRAGMRTTGSEFITQQAAVEIKRPLPPFEFGIQRLPEPARPHLHRATSTRARARDRDGRPRMRMNPSASF